jgi:4-aminobutyrate aminotransferase-like enzyme
MMPFLLSPKKRAAAIIIEPISGRYGFREVAKKGGFGDLIAEFFWE